MQTWIIGVDKGPNLCVESPNVSIRCLLEHSSLRCLCSLFPCRCASLLQEGLCKAAVQVTVVAHYLVEETDGFIIAWESFWLLLHLSVISISSIGGCCSTDSHFPPHILAGPSSAWPEGWSACFSIPGDVQLHTALQVTTLQFFISLWP